MKRNDSLKNMKKDRSTLNAENRQGSIYEAMGKYNSKKNDSKPINSATLDGKKGKGIFGIRMSKPLKIGLAVFLVLCVIGAYESSTLQVEEDAKESLKSYNKIEELVKNNNYEDAMLEIDAFLELYSATEYADDVETIKETVTKQLGQIAKAKSIGLSEAAYINMLNACKSIGIDTSEVSDFILIDNWERGKRCWFTYTYGGSSNEFTVYFDENEAVDSIVNDTTKFIANGEKQYDLSDKFLTQSEVGDIQYLAKEAVLSILKAPSSAEFPGSFLSPYEGWGFSKDGNIVAVGSYVDSQNSFGAMMRSEFYIELTDEGSNYSIVKFVFDGEKII